MYDENGSACRIPLEGRKYSVVEPLTRIVIPEEEMQFMIRLIVEGEN